MSDLLQDIRYGLRQLRRTPGFTIIAALTLALGIGSNVAMFTVVNAVVLRPLPYDDPGQLVMIGSYDTRNNRRVGSIADPDIAQIHDGNQSFQAVAAFHGAQPTLTGHGEPALLSAMNVTEDFYRVFNIAPAMGRTFIRDDYREGAHVAVISNDLWRGRLASDPSIVGASVRFDGEPFTIVGVMPESFHFPGETQLWMPSELGVMRNNSYRQVVARLQSNVTIQQAQAELDTFAAIFAKQNSDPDSHMGLSATGLQEFIVGEVRSALWLFLGAVGLVLLIACANVAHLALARSERRQREITVRAALGAGRWRLARQLLIESSLLTLLGGSLAFLFAVWGSEFLVSLIPPGKIPRLAEIAIDWRVFAFGFLISALAAILFGWIPAWRSSRTEIAPLLQDTARTTGSASGRRFRGFVIVGETAMAVVLLTGAALLLRSFTSLLDVNPGFRTGNVLSMSIALPEPVYQTPQQMTGFYNAVLDRLNQQPGVTAAGLVNWRPLSPSLMSGSIYVEPETSPKNEVYASKVIVSPGYFRAMGIPLQSGREFVSTDAENAPPVAIISQGLAKLLWKDENPVGRLLHPDFPGTAPVVEVIAVVGDITQRNPGDGVSPALYLPYGQITKTMFLPMVSFVVRTESDPIRMAETLRKSVTEADANIAVYQITTMDQELWASVAEPRFQTLLLGLFSALALVLAAIGIYGVMSYSVAASVREIGVRLALGARARDVAMLFLQRGFALTAAGLALGMIGAVALTRLLESMLFQVTPTDPVAFIGALIVLLAAAMIASYMPARRAAGVDPAIALRHD